MFAWQMDSKGRTYSPRAPGRDGSAMTLDDLLADGQPHSGAFIFLPAVQALENLKDAVQVYFLKANAVVGHGYGDCGGVFSTGNADNRWDFRPPEFQGVTDQVCQ